MATTPPPDFGQGPINSADDLTRQAVAFGIPPQLAALPINKPVEVPPGVKAIEPGFSSLPTPPTVGQVIEGFYGLPAELLRQLQAQLLAGHFYQDDAYYTGKKQAVTGFPDESSVDAFKRAVLAAVQTNTPLDQLLVRAAEAAPTAPSELKTVLVSDPARLANEVDAVAQKTLGRNATDEERQLLVGFIQERQRTEQLRAIQGTVPAQASGEGMNPDFQSRLNAMVQASGGRLSITSGFRSNAEQQKLWNDAVRKYGSPEAARRWVAPPGSSNHEKGVAADLSGDLRWAHEHAAEFGLQFPLSNEAWHIEPATPVASTPGTSTPGTSIPGVQVVQQQQVDPTANAEQILRERNPAEAGAHDIAAQFSVFAKLLGGVA